MKRNRILTLAAILGMASQSAVAADTEVEATVSRLSAPEDYNRSRAAHALGGLGPDAKSAHDELFRVALFDDVPKVRHAAANALGKIAKERATADFIARLKTSSIARIREYSVNALMQPELRSPEATVPLFETLRDKNDRVRGRAGVALQFYKNDTLAGLLLGSLEERNDKAREWAPWLLGRMKHKEALEPLHNLLGDDDPKFRKSVIGALRDIGSRTSVSPLINVATQDKDDEVRMRAIECLGELGDRKASPLLLGALDDQNPEIRAYAAGALGALGTEEAKKPLREMFKGGEGREVLAAMCSLCLLEDKQAVPLIVERINDLQGRHPELIAWFTNALAELGAEGELVSLSKHSDSNIRAAAQEALKQVRDCITPALERLLPTPGFHLHVMKDGTFMIDGRQGNIPVLKNAIQSSLNMVDSASISILLSLEEGAGIPSDIRRLIVAPGIAVYSVKRIDVE